MKIEMIKCHYFEIILYMAYSDLFVNKKKKKITIILNS